MIDFVKRMVDMLNGKVDFIVKAKTEKLKILFFTDMQVIDAAQQRFDGRLKADEVILWDINKIKENLYDEMDAVVKATCPDLIIITGDIVYGEFDDKGTTLISFINKMESYAIPWAPVWGNHDNESKMTVKWQCERLLQADHCLFKIGKASGTGNYSIGLINNEGELNQIIYMLYSGGCVVNGVGEKACFEQSQIDWVVNSYKDICNSYKRQIPCFLCFHIPPVEFEETLLERKLYKNREEFHPIVFNQKNGEFGEINENPAPPQYFKIKEILDNVKVNGVFFGHDHINNCSVVGKDGVRWTYVLKTGTYDYHDKNKLGGTLVEVLNNASFDVKHIYYKN